MIEAKDLSGNWKPIPDWPDYLISDNGEIFSKRRGKQLKVWKSPNKYPRVTITKNNIEKSYCTHRLVALAFIPNPLNKRTVNHKDGNKHNSHVSNLEWATQSENQIHAITTGLASVPVLPLGENHPASKLNEVDIEMIKILLNHDFTQDQIAKRFNVHPAHISQIKLGKTWRHLKK